MEQKIPLNCDFCKSSFNFYLLKREAAAAGPALSDCVLCYLVLP